MIRLFTAHPASIGETYPQHMRVALSFAGPLFKAAAASVVHAFLPFLFTKTASLTIRQLNERIAARCGSCPSGRLHRPDLFEVPASSPGAAERIGRAA